MPEARPLERRVRLLPTRRFAEMGSVHGAQFGTRLAGARLRICFRGRIAIQTAASDGGAEDRRDRANAGIATAPPRGAAGVSRRSTAMRRVAVAKNNNLTFDMSGDLKSAERPWGLPLDGAVRFQSETAT